ncbi:hypothetical protein AMECASPLE_020676 [Ameca splendens]|uniref:Uncharacterized protein n=1 Tax=Ameca splendens TaxID=208324 RepID=A0ABV0Z1N2_9TELE
MDTPHGLSLEGHEVALDSRTFSTQESSTEDEGTSAKPGQKVVDLIPSGQRPQLEPIEDCCCSLPSTAHAEEVQVNQAAHNQPHHSLKFYSGCVQRDFKSLEPILNGSIISQACASTLEIPANLLPKISDLPHIVKQRPSTITFSDSTASSCMNSHASGCDSSDGEESSETEKDKVNGNHDDYGDGDNEDVFIECPHSKDLSMTKKKQKKRACVVPHAKSGFTPSNCGYEAEEEIGSKELGVEFDRGQRITLALNFTFHFLTVSLFSSLFL